MILLTSAGLARAGSPADEGATKHRIQTTAALHTITSIRVTLLDDYGNNIPYSIHMLPTGDALIDVEEPEGVWTRYRTTKGRKVFERVSDAIRTSGFFQLQPRYVTTTDGCWIFQSHYSTFIIAVMQAGVTKEVTFYNGCLGHTEYYDMKASGVINGIANLITKETGAGKWVDTDD